MIRWIALVLVYTWYAFSKVNVFIFVFPYFLLWFSLSLSPPSVSWFTLIKKLMMLTSYVYTLLNGPRRASPSPVVRKKTQVIHWFYPKLNENLTYNDIAKTEELRKRIEKENANLNQKQIYSFFLCLVWFILSWMKHWGQSWIKWCKPHFYSCRISLTQFSFSWIFTCSFPQVYCRVDSA